MFRRSQDSAAFERVAIACLFESRLGARGAEREPFVNSLAHRRRTPRGLAEQPEQRLLRRLVQLQKRRPGARPRPDAPMCCAAAMLFVRHPQPTASLRPPQQSTSRPRRAPQFQSVPVSGVKRRLNARTCVPNCGVEPDTPGSIRYCRSAVCATARNCSAALPTGAQANG